MQNPKTDISSVKDLDAHPHTHTIRISMHAHTQSFRQKALDQKTNTPPSAIHSPELLTLEAVLVVEVAVLLLLAAAAAAVVMAEVPGSFFTPTAMLASRVGWMGARGEARYASFCCMWENAGWAGNTGTPPPAATAA